jgi:SAM-dependent methyltransferase
VADLYDDPELYDALLPIGAHLPYYRELARRSNGPVLELACGAGQITIPIALDGVPVVGLDLSGSMLDTARRRAKAAGASVAFLHGDMRRFALRREFALIFIARNSLLHLLSAADIVATLTTVARHLAPGGLFAFDIFNPNMELLSRPAEQRFPVMEVDDDAFGRLRVEGTADYDPTSQVNRAMWYVSTSATKDAWVLPLTLRSIFPQELPLLLEAAGLELVNRFGELDSRPFDGASRIQLCLCRRSSQR